MQLELLSGGAAQGLVGTLAPRFEAETGATIAGTFTAIGAIKDKFLAGAPADLVALSKGMIAELVASGHLVGPGADIGVVRTGVAIRSSDPAPAIATQDDLRASLLAADAVYLPDPKLATAGIHVMKVLDTLGIREQATPKLRAFPNGMTAMHEMAAQNGGRPIAIGQGTEVLSTPGVRFLGPLPPGLELNTTYTAAVSAKARRPELARKLLALLTGPAGAAERAKAGFEVV